MVVPESEAEEIAERRFNARGGFAVPVHAQNQSFQMIWLGIIDREPDVGEFSGTVRIENRQRCAGLDEAKIGISTGRIRAGNALEDVGLRLREVRLPAR